MLDLPTLLNLSLAPLSTETTSFTLSPSLTPTHTDSDLSLLSPHSLGRTDVHRLERRGLKADADLLSQVTRLLSVLTADQWQVIGAVKGGVKVSERLSFELSFFQDAHVFLLLLAPMVSTSAPSSSSPSTVPPALSSPSAAFISSLLTPSETIDITIQFLTAKPSQRPKVFRHYEASYKEREQAEHREAENRSKQIEHQMMVDAEKERRVCKILLLGPGEAGKSTLFKQMKKVYGEGYNAVDKQHHVIIILANLLRAMRALIFIRIVC